MPLAQHPVSEIRDAWHAFKAIETHTAADVERQLALLSDDVVMQNPMMRATGKDEVRAFLLQDIYWSKPVFSWECFSEDRVAMRWSQFPLRTKQREPALLHSCSTWKYAGGGKLSHYFATWCRVEALGVMQDAGMRVDPTTFLGDIVSPAK
ncbi:MAG TPA: nuclear transport factor 2 family protein [Myxococcales bacterium]|nr:nuclear transport factor 2 family protein [Myxococcales bacterium]HIM02983.1 nuclear transport factor 2 family protein [Myxococcales bacterium]